MVIESFFIFVSEHNQQQFHCQVERTTHRLRKSRKRNEVPNLIFRRWDFGYANHEIRKLIVLPLNKNQLPSRGTLFSSNLLKKMYISDKWRALKTGRNRFFSTLFQNIMLIICFLLCKDVTSSSSQPTSSKNTWMQLLLINSLYFNNRMQLSDKALYYLQYFKVFYSSWIDNLNLF